MDLEDKRKLAREILDDNMSITTAEYISKMNYLTHWIIDAMVEFNDKMNNSVLDDVSKPLAPKEVKSCMKADLKCGEVCKEHCGASWC